MFNEIKQIAYHDDTYESEMVCCTCLDYIVAHNQYYETFDKCNQYNPLSIKKTYERQKEDVLKILCYENPLICSQVHECWKGALKDFVEPVGWTALWKISKDMCCKLEVTYPNIAVVEVKNVDYNIFAADVAVIMAPGEFPESILDVPLIELFPTVEQKYDVIDIQETANILQDFRLFFTHLWYPWDEKLNGNEDWLLLHFENRLKLYYDILFDQIDPKIRNSIGILIEEGKYVHDCILELEEQLIQIESNEDISSILDDISAPDFRFLSLHKLHVDLNLISEKLRFYEKKNIRNMIETDITEEMEPVCEKNVISIAWSRGMPSDFAAFVNKVKIYLSSNENMRFECSSSLDKLLSEWKKELQRKQLVLSTGDYLLKSRTMLNVNEGIFQGLDDCEDTVIRDSDEGLSLFDVNCKEFKMCNILLKTTKVKYILLVRSGTCYIKNLKMYCDDRTKIGIFVVSGAKLIAEECHFYNFSTAIYANKGSIVAVTNCTFENNTNGIEFEDCYLSVESCHFINNKGTALFMLSPDSFTVKKGNKALEHFQGVKISDLTFKGNKTDMAKF